MLPRFSNKAQRVRIKDKDRVKSDLSVTVILPKREHYTDANLMCLCVCVPNGVDNNQCVSILPSWFSSKEKHHTKSHAFMQVAVFNCYGNDHASYQHDVRVLKVYVYDIHTVRI